VPDLNLVVDGGVPLGAGLSSSAALECAAAVAIDSVARLGLGRTAIARAAQRAENEFVGAPTGIMDQMAAMHGRAGHVVFLDTRSLDVTSVPLPLAEAGLSLLVVDTRTPHALVDGQYGERRTSCEDAARLLGVQALRDITLTGLDDALGRLPDDQTRRRVRHVVTEDARVLQVVSSLRAGDDPRSIGPALTASHESMRVDFEITVPPVDLAVSTALAAGAYGARMTGGGFGGCVIALIDAASAGRVFDAISIAFADGGFAAPVRIPALASDGAGQLY
jgi:galactokinase